MSGSNKPPSASSSSQARKPASLFDWFKPSAPSTSSPSGHSNASSGRAGSSSNPTGTRGESQHSEDSAPERASANKAPRGSRPGRVAHPGQGLAALKRMATAPAALPSAAPPGRSISRPASDSRVEPASNRAPSSSDTRNEPDSSQATPRRARRESESPTPRRSRAASSPSHRLGTHSTPLVPSVPNQSSSCTMVDGTIEDSDPEMSQRSFMQINPLSSQTGGSLSVLASLVT